MPNERRRRRAARRVVWLPRLRTAPVILLGLFAVAVLGRTHHDEAPVKWTMRAPDAWMADWDGLREARLAALAPAARPMVMAEATKLPISSVPSGSRGDAEVDRAPRDERKVTPRDIVDPEITGSVPKGARSTNPASTPESMPLINRSGKGDRLLSPQPLGRTTDGDLLVKPTLAVVAPTQEGWPPLMRLASLTAPQSEKILPRRTLGAPDAKLSDRIVVAMVRSGPGRVVTPSAIAALTHSNRARDKNRPLLPPMPDQQTASVNPRTTVWAQPPMPELGYTRRTDIESRFKAVLGDEEGFVKTGPAAASNGDDDLPP